MPGFRLAPGADAATVAAHLDAIEQSLTGSPLSERVVLAAGEVLSNAAEHGAEPVDIDWRREREDVVLRVRGPGPTAETIRTSCLPTVSATRGRGLFLIRTLATDVGDLADGLLLIFRPD